MSDLTPESPSLTTTTREGAYPTWKGMIVQLRAVVRIGELLLMASARPGNGTKKGTAR